jgi:hypothetical protein
MAIPAPYSVNLSTSQLGLRFLAKLIVGPRQAGTGERADHRVLCRSPLLVLLHKKEVKVESVGDAGDAEFSFRASPVPSSNSVNAGNHPKFRWICGATSCYLF